MHEYSVVQSLLDLCEEHAKANNCTKITKVVIKIGVMSGVEPQLLSVAFDTFKEKTICDEAILEMIIQKLKLKCNICDFNDEIENRVYLCPRCKSSMISIEDGEDAYLMSLEME